MKSKLRKALFGISLLALWVFVVLPLSIFAGIWAHCKPSQKVENSQTTVDDFSQRYAGYNRPEDQTYLTFPEWYIVYSTDEYANFTKTSMPSDFPYIEAADQYWKIYCQSYATARGEDHPFNASYHSTLVVIGISFTAESLIKETYENTVGKVTEIISSDELTEEDKFAQKTAEEYGEFMHEIPWYEFSFGEKFVKLWTETGLLGANPIRKWERKIMLSTEYFSKAIYAQFIKLISGGVYSSENLQIYAVTSTEDVNKLSKHTQVEVIESLDQNKYLVKMPRYEAFTKLSVQILEDDIEFESIAGNDMIAVSFITSNEYIDKITNAQLLISAPVLTEPGKVRYLVHLKTADLLELYDELKLTDIQLEHIYDY